MPGPNVKPLKRFAWLAKPYRRHGAPNSSPTSQLPTINETLTAIRTRAGSFPRCWGEILLGFTHSPLLLAVTTALIRKMARKLQCAQWRVLPVAVINSGNIVRMPFLISPFRSYILLSGRCSRFDD
jgi:hypothetical protein